MLAILNEERERETILVSKSELLSSVDTSAQELYLSNDLCGMQAKKNSFTQSYHISLKCIVPYDVLYST